MKLGARVALMKAYGTSEGVKKEWDTRGRSHAEFKELVNVREHGAKSDEEHGIKLMNEVPRIDTLELQLTSPKGNNMLRMDRESMKMVLRQALAQLEESGTGQEPKIDYINTPRGVETWHYAMLKFPPKEGADDKPVYGTP